MKKVLIVPDSFKGTLSSREVCDIMGAAVQRRFPGTEVVKLPVADGGEGTVDAFLAAMGGERIAAAVKGPLFAEVPSFYGRLPDGTAVIEMAAAAGLPLVGSHLAVGETTTYGVGQLMRQALEQGAKRLILGLGGSATNDGGCGAAAALGAVFRDAAGEAFVPTGATLGRIASVDVTGMLPQLRQAACVTMCDIDNPLCGPRGAAAVFGPQKGADAALVKVLDAGLAHLAAVVERDLGLSVAELPGAGAAGGMGAGSVAFFGSTLQKGIDTVLDTVHFDALLAGAELVFSGEGKFDAQSLMGKVVIGVARRARKAGVPVICVAGAIDAELEAAYDEGVTAAFSINREPLAYAEAVPHSRENLALMMDNILRVWKSKE